MLAAADPGSAYAGVTPARSVTDGAAAPSGVAVTGVTGARTEIGSELPGLLERLRARTEAPLAVGFGISTPEQAARVAGLADGVIVGSALIDLVAMSADADAAVAAAGEFMRAISAAVAAG